MKRLALLLLAAALFSCQKAARGGATGTSRDAASEQVPIAFIENDYPRALHQARAEGVPIFVDAWALWCHTCQSLRAYVLLDPSLGRFARKFVWLSLDTEREENAPVVTRLGVRVLPTLFVIDSATEEAVLAWPGSLTVRELTTLLEDAARDTSHDDAGGPGAAMLLRGHRASARGDIEEAITDYSAALAAPAAWPGRPTAVDALVVRLSDAKRLTECAITADAETPGMPPGTALIDVLRAGIRCAQDLPERTLELTRLAALGVRVVSDPSQPILADDRSDLYEHVTSALRRLNRADDAKRLAAAWASFLEEQAAAAQTAEERAVFDSQRLLAYVAIGEPQRAVPMLERSERDFPSDYDPPARLGTAYFEMKRYDDALDALARALQRAYGPRKLRLWSLEADVRLAKGDRDGARRALRSAIEFANKVPLTGNYPLLKSVLEQRLAQLG